MKKFRGYFLLSLTLILVLSLTIACGSKEFTSEDSVSDSSRDFPTNEEMKYEYTIL